MNTYFMSYDLMVDGKKISTLKATFSDNPMEFINRAETNMSRDTGKTIVFNVLTIAKIN